jgi:hypothetical protein
MPAAAASKYPRRCNSSISSTLFEPGYQDALARRAARERDRWINNSVASGNLRGRHSITCFSFRSRPSGAELSLVEIDRLRSGKASVPSISPFAGLQTARPAKLLGSHGPISSGRDLISRAL